MTKIRDADLLTLFRHESSNSSTTTNARATSYISSEVHELCVKWGRGWEDGVTSVKNRCAKSYETSGGGRGTRIELGERGITENGAPTPEISRFPPYKTFLQRMADIFGCAGANATKNTPFERFRRAEWESQFARGTGE
ncbi:hypothetical protein PISMIDRAFT_16397 [Pisolithus microcarpus 441]|uniref:Uncharacterized protein n=1 Tax=Pisolithus microcarpus 441 TaxID=765257 RepID=A0A0C9XTE9_9AGAM|nr:hypothetical protein BKA83DRAFT_16397 [Pisolithus microcarpus]KIK15620.1 hypothetical protein PISMIDRAFT_16397 [Pisolithus microcarpus 441]